MLPPAVVVHGLRDARRALAPGRPVTLLSAEGAACFAGCDWWRAMVDRARAQAPGGAAGVVAPIAAGVAANVAAPDMLAPDVLDCAASPGRAVEALRAGCRWIVLAPSCPAFADVMDRAAVSGAYVLARRPAALDLGRYRGDRGDRGDGPRDLGRRLDDWLTTGCGVTEPLL